MNSLYLVRAGARTFSLRYLILAEDFANGPAPENVQAGTLRVHLEAGLCRDFQGAPADAIRRAIAEVANMECEDIAQGKEIDSGAGPAGPSLHAEAE
jgi:hypothetical protein